MLIMMRCDCVNDSNQVLIHKQSGTGDELMGTFDAAADVNLRLAPF